MGMILPVTLTACAAAALIGLWLTIRAGTLRRRLGIAHGDGGNDALLRRMRAQLNFAENTPFALLLIAVIEISGKGGEWLTYAAGLFMLGRVAHALGMDSAEPSAPRTAGAAITMLTLLGLAIYAVLIAARIV